MSAVPNTVRVHQALARSYPVPMSSRDLRTELCLPAAVVSRAVAQCLLTDVVRRVRTLGIRHGYGYTVVLS